MGTCNIDHTVQDVKQKLADQSAIMPKALTSGIDTLLETEKEQHILNEIFHLLKKYDLATQEEQDERNEQLAAYVK